MKAPPDFSNDLAGVQFAGSLPLDPRDAGCSLIDYARGLETRTVRASEQHFSIAFPPKKAMRELHFELLFHPRLGHTFRACPKNIRRFRPRPVRASSAACRKETQWNGMSAAIAAISITATPRSWWDRSSFTRAGYFSAAAP